MGFPQMAVNVSQGKVRGLVADVHLRIDFVGKEIGDGHWLIT